MQLPPGTLHIENFLQDEEAQRLKKKIISDIAWRHDNTQPQETKGVLPRLLYWMGDQDAVYTNSNLTMHPQPWTAEILALRQRLEKEQDAKFNAVLLNYYRNGNDCIQWHSNSEPELGHLPVIAMLSLGATREMRFRPRNNVHHVLRLNLKSGSLLLMRGRMQKEWQHSIMKFSSHEERLNLTFRQIHERPKGHSHF